MNKEKNYNFHQIALICIFVLGNLIISFPKGNGVPQSLSGLIICLAVSFLAVCLYAVIQSYKPLTDKRGMGIFDNRFLNIGVCSLFLLFTLICYLESAGDFSGLADEIWLPDTPKFIISAVFLAVSIWLSTAGKKCIYCFAFFSGIFIVLAVLFMFFASFEKFNSKLLFEVFDFDFKYTFRQAGGFYIHGFGQIMICLLFIGYSKRKVAVKQQLFGIGIAGLIIIILLINTAALLGSGIIKSVSFPYATATSIINAQGEYTRLDAITYYIYFITSLIKTSIIYKTAVVLASRINNRMRNFTAAVFPITAFVASCSKNFTEFLKGDFISTVLLFFEIAIPLFFFFVIKRKVSSFR